MIATEMRQLILSLEANPIFGRQEPTENVGILANTAFADYCIDTFLPDYGFILDPWQRYVLRYWLSYQPNGKFSHSRCGLSVPRQSGKSALLEARALIGMVLLGEKILFTAHTGKTARGFFQRLKSFFENEDQYPELAAMLASTGKSTGIKESTGMEAIWLQKEDDNGRMKPWGSLQVLHRSKNSGRGLTVDVVLYDEAQELSDASQEALGPTTSAAPRGNRQQIYCGTPPSEEADSAVFTRYRTELLDGNGIRSCYHEWSIPEGMSLDSPESWAYANPAMGYRLSISEIAEDRFSGAYSDDGFARERGGMWSAAVTATVIDPEMWRLVRDVHSQVTDPIAIGVDISPDRSIASIAIAGVREDGLYHVEATHTRAGTAWLKAELTRMVAQWGPVAVAVDGPASTLVPELAALDVPVFKTVTTEFAAACGLFFDYASSRQLRHPGDPSTATAIDSARKRSIGDMWAWGRKNSESDITPVVAMTVALYAFINARPKKKAKKRKSGAFIL